MKQNVTVLVANRFVTHRAVIKFEFSGSSDDVHVDDDTIQ